jgi:hypothetical protein
MDSEDAKNLGESTVDQELKRVLEEMKIKPSKERTG